MKFDNILLCLWTDLYRVTEQESIQQGRVISLYDKVITNQGYLNCSLMIFIGQADNNIDYEVKIYKSKKTDKYVKLKQDNFARYEETDHYVSFFFHCYYQAHKFADNILPLHKEFNDRPIQPIVY